MTVAAERRLENADEQPASDRHQKGVGMKDRRRVHAGPTTRSPERGPAAPRPTNAEMAQLVAMLEESGLIEVYVDEQGREAYRHDR